MTDPAAPTPLSLVPAQRDSSGLDAAGSMHPSIPWSNGDGLKHGRASSEKDAGTRCGGPGPLELAPKDAACCGACYPEPEAAPEDEAEPPVTPLRNFVKHVRMVDRGYTDAIRDSYPVSIAYELWLDGERAGRVVGESNFPRAFEETGEERVRNSRWTLEGCQIDGTILTLWVAAGDLTILPEINGHTRVLLFGRDVLTPADRALPVLDGLDPAAAVQFSMFVGEFTVGPRPEAAE